MAFQQSGSMCTLQDCMKLDIGYGHVCTEDHKTHKTMSFSQYEDPMSSYEDPMSST